MIQMQQSRSAALDGGSNKLKQQQLDFEWALGINRLGSEFLGIWPAATRRRRRSLLHVPCIISIMFIWVFLPQAWGLALVIEQLPLVIENLLTSCPALASCFKLYFLWRNQAGLRLVIESAERDWLGLASAEGCIKSPAGWRSEMMCKQAARARLITVIDHAVILFSYLGFVFLPLVNFELRTFTNVTDYGPRRLLLQSYYPYNYSASPYFELTQASQHLGGFFVTVCSSIPENFFGALVFHSSAQFDILALQFQRFFEPDDPADDLIPPHYRASTVVDRRARGSIVERRRFASKLKTLVDRHVHLMTMVTIIENSFTYVMLAQVACTSVMICSAGFQMIGMFGGRYGQPSPLQIVTLMGIIFTMMMHTLLECYASSTLSSKKQRLFEGLCKCNWYVAISHRRARDLIPVLSISQFPRQLTAGKMLALSLPAFCTILKTTAGYISMLLAVTTR